MVVTASLGDGFLAGTAAATLLGEGTELTLDVALRPSGSVQGQVVQADGVTPAPTSVVVIESGGTGGGKFSTATDAAGGFAFDRVPAGLATLSVDVLGSLDRGRATADVPAGGTVNVVISLNGVGAVAGLSLDSSGQPVAGNVRLSATGAIPFESAVQTDGTAPSGSRRSRQDRLRCRSRSCPDAFPLYGTSAGTVVATQETLRNVQLQPSGTVRGRIMRPDATTPAAGAEVRVVLDAARGAITRFAGNDGTFQMNGVPLGGFDIVVRDQFTGGVALATGRQLVTNGQTLDVGDLVLDDTPVEVVSIDPANGALNVPTHQAVVVVFSDPLASAAGVTVRNGPTVLQLTTSLSTDRRVVTLSGLLPSSAELIVDVTTQVTDVFGRRLTHAVTSRFTTLAVQPPADLITNGTFDTNAAGWALVGACEATAWAGLGNPPGSLRIEACGETLSDPTARQTLNNLTPGTRYLVSVDVRVHNLVSPTATSFGVFLDAQPANPIALAGFFDFAWHTVQASFTATSSTHTLIFGTELDARTPGVSSNSDVSYYIDNVSVRATSLTGISLTPSPVIVNEIGETRQLTVVGTFSDGATLPIAQGVTFSSSNPTVATVSGSGLVTGVSIGSATITASYGALTPAQSAVTVTSSDRCLLHLPIQRGCLPNRPTARCRSCMAWLVLSSRARGSRSGIRRQPPSW